MLYYSPQIWTSDDTDAFERLKIQHGTSLVYPPSAMGAHVSACPNHITGRTVPFTTRAHTALAGTFGYELDVTKLPEDERSDISRQIADYKRYSHLVRCGDLYRLANVSENDGSDARMFVSKDKSEALLIYVQAHSLPNYPPPLIRLRGLLQDGIYTINGTGSFSGITLMNCGIRMNRLWGDYQSTLTYIALKQP